MPISVHAQSGGKYGDAQQSVALYSMCVTVPDAGNVLTIDAGRWYPVGTPAGIAMTPGTLNLPAPAAGATFWNVIVNNATGVLSMQTSVAADPVIPAGSTCLLRGKTPAGTPANHLGDALSFVDMWP
jgi:hypothetical protein